MDLTADSEADQRTILYFIFFKKEERTTGLLNAKTQGRKLISQSSTRRIIYFLSFLGIQSVRIFFKFFVSLKKKRNNTGSNVLKDPFISS